MSPLDHGGRSAWLRTTSYTLLLVLIAVVVRLPILLSDRAIDDEVNYSVVARQMIDGGVLYRDVVERRPPATFWVYAAVFRTFGAANWFALHAVATAWVLLTMLALYAIGTRLANARAGYLAALLYGVFQPWWYWGNLAFNGEVLMNLPVAAAFAVCLGATRFRPARFVVAGALISAGFLLKQPAAIAIVPLFVYALHPGRARRLALSMRSQFADATCLAIGSLTVVAAVALWLQTQNVLHEAVYWSVLDHDVPYVFWDKAVERTLAFVVVAFPVVAAAGYSTANADTWRRHNAERDALVCLLVVSAIGAATSGRFYPHYYIGVLPPLCVLAAVAASSDSAWTIRSRWIRTGAVAWIVSAVIGTMVNQSIVGSHDPERSESAAYIRAHSNPDDRVFVWGRRPWIYLESDRRPASRFIDTFALTGRIFGPSLKGIDTASRIVPGSWEQLREDFEQHPPAFIVDADSRDGAEYPVDDFPWLAERLRRDYIEVALEVDGVIYRRRGAGSNLRASE
jgi:4-amino-4-deoxy-L-arabinose transferase-like glycosyltransferase